MKIFAPDGFLARTLNRTGDLIILNLLTIICCLPVVTAGAAITALYSVTLCMVKNEEGHVAAGYMRAFKENFCQATVLWLGAAAVIAILTGDIYLLKGTASAGLEVYRGGLIFLLVLVLMVVSYLFPVLARYENTLKNTVKNAFLFCMVHPVRSLMMILIFSIPAACLCISYRFISVLVLAGISGPVFLASMYYRSVFQKYAREEREVSKKFIKEEEILL
ncbi:YesL family protein [Faecalicatena orotica]|uniref:YesL family protein n=1 Tax=Faecalicatena orotica TaxID=1544 RepID=UPI003216D480